MNDEHEVLYTQVGQRVREARDAAGITQGQLGQRIGLTRASVTNIETARQNVQLHTLYAIAGALEVPIGALLPLGDQAPRDASPRLQRALLNTQNVRPTERAALQELLSGAAPLGVTVQRPGRMERVKS